MAEVPEDFYPGPEEETPEPETPGLPGPLNSAEDAETDSAAEASPEPPSETDQEPQPEIEREDFGEGEPEGAPNVWLRPAWTPEDDIATDAETDFSSETEPRIPREVKSETSGEMEWEIFKDLEVPADGHREEPGLEPPEEAESDVTEAVGLESDEDTELSSEVPVATMSGKIFELLEEIGQQMLGESLREQFEETDLEPPAQTRPDFLSEKPRKGVEETDLEPPEMADPEIPEETQREFPEDKPTEEVPEPLEEIKSEFFEEESRKPSLESSEEPEVPEETRRKSNEGVETKPPETTGLTPLQEVQEQTQRKSPGQVLEPTEDQTKKQTQSTEEIGLPQKSKTEETLGDSTEETSLEPPEQIKPEFPEKEPGKPVEETGQVPPQQTEPEAQEETITKPAEERSLELPDETKQRETHVDFSQGDRSEPVASGDKDELEHPENLKKDIALESIRDTEVISVTTDYEYYPELQKVAPPDDTSTQYSNVYPSETQIGFGDLTEETVDLSQELKQPVPKGKRIQPTERIVPKFDYLQWSPERVAEWISELGFPQYKECFTANFISGRKLIHVNCSNLPQMGITDFEHMKAISRHTRELLGIEEPLFRRTIRLPYRDNIGLFLEQKAHTGAKSDSLTFSEFVKAARLQDYVPQRAALEENGAYYTEP
ncbi:sterile alpha motif domain-containing protein 15 isoform X1 [Lepus europaeus]|uniref:sterile alpha motif domain-containing protein 15 isoform X1 n=1 Tax=Lepus europaeus TaxID=9983 RepID=UPI002B45F827|nr:sterile alpha motif domain-containing protein 15 isoform X1 [Lepus europaeus]